MSRTLALKEAKAVIKDNELNTIIKRVQFASQREFTEEEVDFFKFAYRHGFADGMNYGKQSLLEYLNE